LRQFCSAAALDSDVCEDVVKATLVILLDAFAQNNHLRARFALASLWPMRRLLVGRPQPEAPTVEQAAYLCAVGLKVAGFSFELAKEASEPLDNAIQVL